MRKALLGLAVLAALFVVSGASAQTTYQPAQATVPDSWAVMFFYELPGGGMAIQMNAGTCGVGFSYAADTPNPQGFNAPDCTEFYVRHADGSVDATMTFPQVSGTLTGSGLHVTVAATVIHLHGAPIFRGLKWSMVSYNTSLTVQ